MTDFTNVTSVGEIDHEDLQSLVVITLETFLAMHEDVLFLEALQMAGVDNWCGYDEIDESRVTKALLDQAQHILKKRPRQLQTDVEGFDRPIRFIV